jgi:hypothetical protein
LVETCGLEVWGGGGVMVDFFGAGKRAFERGDEVEVGVDAAGSGKVGASAIGRGIADAGA